MSLRQIAVGAVCSLMLIAGGVAAKDLALPNRAGRVVTVNGELAPTELGFTLVHEHLFVDMNFPALHLPQPSGKLAPIERRLREVAGSQSWVNPQTATELAFFRRLDISIDMIDDIRRGLPVRANNTVASMQMVLPEVRHFQLRGGRTIVDVTPIDLGRDPLELRNLSAATGVHVVMGTGWYRWPWRSPETSGKSIEELAATMIRDVVTGVADTGIRAGIIGEIPIDYRSLRLTRPLTESYSSEELARERAQAQERDLRGEYHPEELRVLRAAARASVATGAPLSLHYKTSALPPHAHVLTLLQEEGVDLSHVVLGHSDDKYAHFEHYRPLFETGAFLAADRLGANALGAYESLSVRSVAHENHAVALGIVAAIQAGFISQILLSHDVCTRTSLSAYGGSGYTYLHDYFIPHLRGLGVTDRQIEMIMVDNPRRLLTFRVPRQQVRH